MTTEYDNAFSNSNRYLKPAYMGGMYDGASSGSSAASPLYTNGYDNNMYGAHISNLLRSAYPVQDPVTAAAMGLIPVELDIEGLYETQDRRRKASSDDKVVPPHVHSRRRAQNRASQRAFRDRKEKRMKEIEEKLTDLQGQHSNLARSYQTLQVEYTAVKAELDTLRMKHESASPESSYGVSGTGEWQECRVETSDPLLFDVSAFCYDHEEDAGQRGTGG